MIDLQRLEGPLGIPILYQQMPEMVQSVALSWVMFTGSADDNVAGFPGLYHWFEHVPFRGTKKFPGGYEATRGWATRYGGDIGATTGKLFTRYDAFVPIQSWSKALEVITDLISQPLARPRDVEAERLIIHKEIDRADSDQWKFTRTKISKLLYGEHPFGHSGLGTKSSLDSMDATRFLDVWRAGYDHSRMILICIGNVPSHELEKELWKLELLLPYNCLSERRRPANYGLTPEWQCNTHIEKTNFSSSLVYMLFPYDNMQPPMVKYSDGHILNALFTLGGLASPLYRIIREERSLAYATSCYLDFLPHAGHFGFCVETEKKHVEATISALHDVLKSPTVRSEDRLEEIKTGIRYGFKMRAIDTKEFRDTALRRYVSTGEVLNDRDYEQFMSYYPIDRVRCLLEKLTPERARTFVFEGTS